MISGSRYWDDMELEQKISWMFSQLPPGTLILHGGARGVDSVAERMAPRFGFITKVFLPDWNKYGKAAGPMRNSDMLFQANYVFLFHKDISSSKGTKDVLIKCRKMGKPHMLIE